MSILNLGCGVNRVAITPKRDSVDLFVPRNAAPDMGRAIAYAEGVLPTVKHIMVFEEPIDELVLGYWRGSDGDWHVEVPGAHLPHAGVTV